MPGKPRLIPGPSKNVDKIPFWGLGSVVAHWSLMLCAAALGIILGETYQKPQATSYKQQAPSFKQQALDIYRLRDYIGYRKDKIIWTQQLN